MHDKILDNHMHDNLSILKRHSSIRLLTKEGGRLDYQRMTWLIVSLSTNNAETDTVYKYLEKSWFLYEVKASVMFIGEKWQPWRKNSDILISTVMKWLTCLISVISCSGYIGTLVCFAICNKILNNKTLLIQDRFVFVTFIWQKCISKGYGENGRPCIMPYQ